MDSITTKEATKNPAITYRMVMYSCSVSRINGAKKIGNKWLVPTDAEKPADERYRSIKVKDGENK